MKQHKTRDLGPEYLDMDTNQYYWIVNDTFYKVGNTKGPGNLLSWSIYDKDWGDYEAVQLD